MKRPKSLYVLIACEESQAETTAFRAYGHRAYSCDVKECSITGNPRWHIKGDVTPFLQGRKQFVTQAGLKEKVPRWDLIICHPPCTYLSKISSVHMVIDGMVQQERYIKMLQAREFFFKCLNADAQYVAVENPIPMQRAELPPPSCYACPSWYGEPYTKKTLYWTKNLPPLMAAQTIEKPTSLLSSTSGKYRSRTSRRMAVAIAQQWGDYVVKQLTKLTDIKL